MPATGDVANPRSFVRFGRRELADLVASLGPPLLFGMLPGLTVASANTDQLNLDQFLPVLGWSAALTAGSWMAIFLVSGDRSRASLYTILTLIWVSAYGYVEDVLPLGNTGFTPTLLLTGIWSILGLLLAWMIHRSSEKALRNVLRVATAAGVGATVAALVPVAQAAAAGSFSAVFLFGELPEIDNARIDTTSSQARDVYYIVPDRYASNGVLRRYFHHNNDWFTDELRRHGFYVAEKSLANYLRTAHSLAVALNLDYLDVESRPGFRESDGYAPFFRAIDDNRLARILKRHGYEYYHLGSWWNGSSRSRLADYDYMGQEEPWCAGVAGILVQNSVLGRALATLGQAVCGTRDRQRQRVERKLELLVEIAEKPEPTFTFAHLLIPHEPFVFAADGRHVSSAEAAKRPWRELYVEQLEYLNHRLIDVVASIRRRSDVEPIIVLQADEGPFSYKGELAVSYYDWCGAPPDSAFQKFGILSALLLPEHDRSGLWDELSPVNSFRLILREYLGYDLPSLPDKSYVFPMDGSNYDLTEVTEALKWVRDTSSSHRPPPPLCPGVPEGDVRQGRRGVATPFRIEVTETN